MKIFSAYHHYNANANGKDVGDCVKRGLSLAFGLDYNEVANELNKIKREKYASAYNEERVFKVFLERRGLRFSPYQVDGKRITVDEFCESHPVGTYLLLTGRGSSVANGKGTSSHLCCVVNRDVYDSWDSRNDYVVDVCLVSKESRTLNKEMRVSEITDRIDAFAYKYMETYQKKNNWFDFEVRPSLVKDQYTAWYKVKIWITVETPKHSSYYKDYYNYHNFVYVLNPNLDIEANVVSLEKKLKQKMYDWLYIFKKDLKDAEAVQHETLHEDFWGDAKLLMKIPAEYRKYVRKIETYYDNWEHRDIIEVDLDRDMMEETPNPRWRDFKYIREYTWRDVNNEIQWAYEDAQEVIQERNERNQREAG